MRSFAQFLFLLPISALQVPSIFAPFYEPILEDSLLLSNISLIPTGDDLRKRDGNCPDNFNSCSTLAAADAGACCSVGTFCTTDKARNIACCPTGATCTGSLTVGTVTTTNGAGAVFGTGTASATGTTTTTSTADTATITPTGTVSYVSNAFFPWPYIPTSYVNSQACMTAYTDCQSNYAACTVNLQGGNSGFAVTIVAPGGGVTAGATVQSLGLSSATSICSSLYAQGCYNLATANCAQFGTATATGFIVATTTGAAARPTMGGFATAGLMAGVGIGMVGQML